MEWQSYCQGLKFLQTYNQFEIFCNYSVKQFTEQSLICFRVFTFQKNGQIIKIKVKSLKSDLNRLVFQSNVHFISNGFKFKINPLTGLLYLEFSSFYDQKKIHLQDLKKNIILKYRQSKQIRNTFYKIMLLIKKGTLIQNSQAHKKYLLKFGYNSSFYAWNIWSNTPNKKKKQKVQKKQKLQMWSDEEDSMNDSTMSQDYTDSQVDCLEKQNQGKNSNKTKQDLQLSQFYKKSRQNYDKLNLIPGKSKLILNNDIQIQQNHLKRIKDYFISTEQDTILYKKYLKISTNQCELSNQNKKYQEEDLNDLMETTSQNVRDIIQRYVYSPNSNHISIIKEEEYFDTQNEKGTIILNSFLECSQSSISKATKWRLVLSSLQVVRLQIMKKGTKANSLCIDNKLLKLNKGLTCKISQNKQELQFPLYSNNKKIPKHHSPQQNMNFNIIDSIESEQEDFQRLDAQQRKLSSVILNLICWIIFPKQYLMNKGVQTRLKNLNKEKQYNLNLDKWMQGSEYKFYHTNLEMQTIFLYLYQNSKMQYKKPYTDWVIIMCNYFNEIVQKNSISV